MLRCSLVHHANRSKEGLCPGSMAKGGRVPIEEDALDLPQQGKSPDRIEGPGVTDMATPVGDEIAWKNFTV